MNVGRSSVWGGKKAGGRKVLRGSITLPPGLVTAVERLPSGRTKLVFSGQTVRGRATLMGESLVAPRRTRVGSGGTSIMSGKIRYEEFNTDLENEKGYGQWSKQGVFDKMRRTSSQIQRLLWLVKLPVLAADPCVEPDERDEDGDREEIADLVQHNLFELIPGRRRLREALTMLEFGFAVFEATADAVEVPRARFPGLAPGRSGRPREGERVSAILFTDLELRPAKTVYRWQARPEKTTQVQELQQWPPATDGGLAPSVLRIPGDWLLRFTHEQEGGNFQGVSLLRPVYKPWVLLDTLESGAIAFRVDAKSIALLRRQLADCEAILNRRSATAQ